MPRRSEPQMRFALEKRRAVTTFQFLDMSAQRLLSDKKFFRRAAKIHRLRRHEKIAQPPQTHEDDLLSDRVLCSY